MATRATTTPEVDEALRRIAGDHTFRAELKSERLVAAFERQILSGLLAPGTRLPTEGELCDQLNVSRSVIRDAIRSLVARGLVTVRQGRGMTVAMPSDTAFSGALLVLLTRSGVTMGDVIEARSTIETRLIGLAAASGTDEEWAQLEATLDEFAGAVAEGDDALANEKHAAFHIGIMGAIHQPALDLMLKPLTQVILVSSTASLVRSSPEDWEVEVHRPILEALKAGDAAAAEQAMAQHFEVSTAPAPYKEFLDRKFSDAYFDVDSGNGLTP